MIRKLEDRKFRVYVNEGEDAWKTQGIGRGWPPQVVGRGSEWREECQSKSIGFLASLRIRNSKVEVVKKKKISYPRTNFFRIMGLFGIPVCHCKHGVSSVPEKEFQIRPRKISRPNVNV